MPITEAKFKIGIRTTADNTGIETTERGIGGLTDSTKKLSSATADAADSQKNLGHAGEISHEKIHEGAEHSTLKHRELKEAVRAVGAQFGGLADVGLWLSPELAGLAALLAAVEALKKGLEQMAETAARANEALRQIDDAKLKSASDAAAELVTGLQDIQNEEAKLTAAYAAGNAALTDRIKRYNEEKDAIIAVETAREKAFEADIDNLVKSGQLSKEQGEARKESARLQLESDRLSTDAAKAQHELDQQINELNNARLRVRSGADLTAFKSAQAAEEPVMETAKVAAAKLKTAQETPAEFQGRTFATDDDLNKHKQESEQRLAGLEGGRPAGLDEAQWKASIEATRIYLTQLDEVIKKRREHIEALEAESRAADASLSAAKNRTTIARDQLSRDEELNRTGPDRLTALQAQLRIHQNRDRQILDADTRSAQARVTGVRIEENQRAQEALAHGHGTPEQIAAAQDAAAQAQWNQVPNGRQIDIDMREGRSALELLQMLGRQGRGTGDQNEIHDLLNRFIGLARNLHASAAQRRDLSALQRQVDQLERSVANHDSRLNQSPNVQGW